MLSSLFSFPTCAQVESTRGKTSAFSKRPHRGDHARYNPDQDEYDPVNMVIKATPADALRVQMCQLEGQLQKLQWTIGAQSSCVRDRSTVEHYETVAREIEDERRLLEKQLQSLNELDKVFSTKEMASNLDKALMEHMDTKSMQNICMRSMTKSSLPKQTLNDIDKVIFFTEEMENNLDWALMEHTQSMKKSSKRTIIRCPSNTSTAASLGDIVAL
eukprot:gnl/MRDRNA2_/MRDRNA2_33848_c0_seq2.p1 gnl/MRDRNA2_/MRDRNA2_33848_c0~~gnl/MRDRNA2_/MRDRNA2_33848_c0_seq2.p1  ORF type:complete len:216 (-),score=52.84 gnl/MRDRNA2_/MRDRNA2_33848_c0_seq2:768-1415(-)